ncbi:hypothetical protein [Amycolatopsis sp. NPDC004378]
MAAVNSEPLGHNAFRRLAGAVPFDAGAENRAAETTAAPAPVEAPGQHDHPPASTTSPARMEHTAGLTQRPCAPPPRPAAATSPADTNSTTPVSTTPPPGGPPMPLAGPAAEPAEPEGLRTLEAELAQAARRTWAHLPAADVDAAVEAGMLAAAAEAATTAARAEQALDGGAPGPPGGAAHAATIEVAAAAAALQRQGLPPAATTPVDWSGFGTVVPVLAGSPGAGASVLAAVVADVLQLEQRRVLLVDPADPPRSGLAAVARSQGPWLAHPHPRVHIRYSWRAQALVARLETELPVLAPGMVPPPRFWRPPVQQLDATVVDLGHDPWRITAHPLSGAGAWLRRGTPQPRPLLVVRPSRPSLLHAEQVLARLEHWISCAAATGPAQLVVAGAKRWPDGVAGAAGRRVAALLPDAVFLPLDSELAAAGVTAAVTPARLRQAITPVLRRWGLLPDTAGKSRRSSTRGRS